MAQSIALLAQSNAPDDLADRRGPSHTHCVAVFLCPCHKGK
jgi:hypothetical protein